MDAPDVAADPVNLVHLTPQKQKGHPISTCSSPHVCGSGHPVACRSIRAANLPDATPQTRELYPQPASVRNINLHVTDTWTNWFVSISQVIIIPSQLWQAPTAASLYSKVRSLYTVLYG